MTGTVQRALDRQGLPVTTHEAATLDAVDRFQHAFISYGTDFQPAIDAAERDTGAPLVQALAAAGCLFLESPAGFATARPFVERALAARDRGTAREALVVDAVAAWAAGDMERAITLHHHLAEAWPADVFAAKIGQYHCFNRGDCAGILALAEPALAAGADHPYHGYAWGMAAFGYEQCHRLEEAEAAGRRAVAIERTDAWAHHAVAHVLDTTGRVDEGLDWMRAHADTWERCNSFMLTHNWWHTALFHLDRDEVEAALALHDARVWGVWKAYSQDQINAISLLARLELRPGAPDLGERWRDVGAHVAARGPEHVNGFLDLQYLLALHRAGEKEAADRFVTSLRARAAGDLPPVWAETVLPAAEGIAAYATGDWPLAADRLSQVHPRLIALGGSHAQRDLFDQILIESLLRDGRMAEARRLIRARLESKPNIVWNQRLLARCSGEP
ncbi:MAG: tetratricopeptide repeat protein [Azospirillaceae bacterium]